jgi:type III secretion system YscQ/HrcQ family protein
VSPAPTPRRSGEERAPVDRGAAGEDDEESTDAGRPPARQATPARASPPPPIPNPRRAPPPREPEPERIKLPSPALKPRPYQKFQWTGLPRIAAAEAELLQHVQWVLPIDPARASAAVATRFKSLFEHDCGITLTKVFVSTPEALRKIIPEPAYLAQLSLAPEVPRGALEVELAVAHAAIDQLLGGAAGEAVVLRALTDIEEGVLGYVLLEGLKALHPSLDPSRPRLRVEAALHGVEEAVALFEPRSLLAVLQYHLAIGEVASGYFRLFLPATAVAAARPEPGSQDQRERRTRAFERHGDRLALVHDALRFEIARCELSALDLRGLGQGDVVLLEDPTARPDLGEGGTCKVRVGLGQRGHWKASLELGEDGLQATLDAVELGTELPAPLASPPATAPDAPEMFSEEALPGGRTAETTLPAPGSPWDVHERTSVNSSDSRGAELLNDIPLHVSVEVARVPVSAAEVVALRAGQVLQLGRPPTSAVELSVNGKIVAQGELVEVDGQLGVKITALVA